MNRLKKFAKKVNRINLSLDSKILLLTHNDLDGSGSAVLLRSIFDNVTVVHCSNATMDYQIKQSIVNKEICDLYDAIFVTDISCTAYTASQINHDPDIVKLFLLDHHTTAAYLNRYKWAFVESEMLKKSFRIASYHGRPGKSSGTSLMYDFLQYYRFTKYIYNDDLARLLVFMITAYDTWDWVEVFNKEGKYHDLNTLFWIYQADLFDDVFTEKMSTIGMALMSESEKFILKIEKNRIAKTVETKMNGCVTGSFDFHDHKYTIVYCYAEQHMSDIFDKMKQDYSDRDIALINYGTGISMRSINPEVNVANIVKELGGGGHPGAGGFKIPFENQKEYFENALNTKIILDKV